MLRKFLVTLAIAVALAVGGVGCSLGGDNVKSIDHRAVGLASGSDSLAYIIGMNIAEQLQKMDSTINIGVVCRAIVEQSEGESVFSRSQAREAYIRYLLYTEPEQRRSYEERFLADLAANNRDFTRTKSGLTYHIGVIGDESIVPKSNNDWVTLKCAISRVGGEVIVADTTFVGALSDLPTGIEESIKMIGKGGRVEAWIASKLAYGEAGEPEMGIEPTETLRYEIEVVDVEKGAALKYKKELEQEEVF